MPRPLLYRSTFPNEPFRLNEHGILWLTDSPEVAVRYLRRGREGLLWKVRLRDDAKIVDLTDLSVPLTRKVYDALDQYMSNKFSVGVDLDSWPKYANFSLLENYPWVRTMLMRAKRQGAVVYDKLAGTNIDHLSVALFTLKAVEAVETERYIYDQSETIGAMTEVLKRWQHENPASMKPFRGLARGRK